MKKLKLNFAGSMVYAMLFFALAAFATACNGGSSTTQGDDENGTATNGEELVGDPTLVSSQEELETLMAFDKGDYAYSVEDFFKNPEKLSYKISPNGEYFSYLGPFESRLNVYIQKIGSDEAARITSETERDIAGYIWGNDNRILYIKDDGGDENYSIYAVDRDGENLINLTPFDSVTIQIIDDLEDIEDEIIVGLNKRNKQIFDPYRLNIKTGDMTMLYENPGNITSWMTDHAGQLRIATVTDGINSTLMHRASEDEEFAPVLTTDFTETMNPMFFTFDNNDLYCLSNLGRDKAEIVLFNLESASEVGDPLFKHNDVDVSGLSYSRKRKVITTASYTTDKRHVHFFDDVAKELYGSLKSKLGDYEVVVSSTNKEENKFLVRTYSDRSLGSYYFYDRTTDELIKLTDVSPWIDEDDMANMRPIKYKSRDGLTIHGYLSIPKDSEGMNLPVVINPHGGPWYRNSWGYNPEVQLFTSRGYAVLQMNFRGSTGYGKDFWKSSFKEWGKSMQDDISDGVEWLVSEGIADPNRVAIYGGSYGGYATLAGVTYTPQLYACGIDYVGVSNLFTFMKTIPPYWKPYLDMMYEMVGDPTEESDSLRMIEQSPVFHVDKIEAPLFVIQGANDPRVNIDESDQIVRALRDKGVDVPYLVKYNEGHGFHNEENRIEAYKYMVGFLAKHLKQESIEG